MFNFSGMMGNYESRKVGRYDSADGSVMVSTARVTDSRDPYETAVAHPRYNKGEMVIVQMYDTKDEAKAGHDAWVAKMTGDTLPESLKDVSTAGIALLCDITGSDWRTQKAS